MDEGIRPRLTLEPPAEERLRGFGRGLAIILALLALIAWRRHHLRKMEAEAGLAALCAMLAQFVPGAYAWPERLWMPVANVLERVNTAALMGLVYFLVVTPLAVLARLLGSDPLDRELRTAQSYWTPKKRDEDPARYERQY